MHKIFQIICVLVFFISFGYVFGDDFWKYQETQKNTQIFQESVSIKNEDFSLESLSQHEGNLKLWTTPSKDFLEKLVAEIDAATTEILVEVYIFTERDLRDALIRAHKRGVEVQILLENNPYKAPYLNDNHYNDFIDAGLNVRWSDPLNYSLNHSKLLIIDEGAYVATGNFSYATFTKNRDIFIEIQDTERVGKLRELFMLDFEHQLGGVFHESLLISPYSSRSKIENLIAQATESIDFYFPYMTDSGLEAAFSEQVRSGVRLRGIVGSDYFEENRDDVERLENTGWDLYPMKTPKLHAKAILVDKKYLYIGSINFSTYSLDENREIGMIMSDKNIVTEFQNIFAQDLQVAQ